MLGIISLALQTASAIVGISANERAAAANRRMANRAAKDVEALAEQNVGDYERKLSQLMGQQRVAGAAQNIALDEGTMAQIERQTAEIGAEDVRRIRENARREAWGIRTQAKINQQQARYQSIGMGLQLGATLLSKAPSAWSSFVGGRGSSALPTGTMVPPMAGSQG